MRSLFGLLLAVSLGIGCTRANPDAFSLPVQDLATPPLTGGGGGVGGGSGSGGGGATAGGGGTVDVDLAVDVHDLAVVPPDLRDPLSGVKCGTNVTCSPESKDDVCCLTTAGDSCIAANATCTNGVTVSCDGPEDCTSLTSGGATCCGTTMVTAGGKGASCGNSVTPGCTPLCHEVSDCPTAFPAYTICCATTGAPYQHCSRTACK